jgi:hypothetical protein
MEELKESAEIALRDCMALKKSETLLVVTDDKTIEIGMTLFEVGKNFWPRIVFFLSCQKEK